MTDAEVRTQKDRIERYEKLDAFRNQVRTAQDQLRPISGDTSKTRNVTKITVEIYGRGDLVIEIPGNTLSDYRLAQCLLPPLNEAAKRVINEMEKL